MAEEKRLLRRRDEAPEAADEDDALLEAVADEFLEASKEGNKQRMKNVLRAFKEL